MEHAGRPAESEALRMCSFSAADTGGGRTRVTVLGGNSTALPDW